MYALAISANEILIFEQLVSVTEHQNSFEKTVFAFGKTSIINTLDSFEKSCCIPEAFRDALVIYNTVCCTSFLKSQEYPAQFFF